MAKWIRHFYQPGLPLGEDGTRVTGSKEHIKLSREAAAEGMVLLKNENELLPLKKGCKVALFGKACVDYVRGGGGSGAVTVAYERNLYEGLKIKASEGKVEIFEKLADYYDEMVKKQYSEGIDPGMTEEVEIPSDLLSEARSFADVAIVTISRFSGEGWDRKANLEHNDALWAGERILAERQAKVFPDSDFCLTAKEKQMLEIVKKNFSKVVVVINSGGVIETRWIKDDDAISSALFMWQGGIEGGLAVADLLVGDSNPSGKLVDSFAEKLEDYPSSYNFHDSRDYVEYTDDIYVGYRYFETIPGVADKVVYPFGYGLSYTKFDTKVIGLKITDEDVILEINVKNVGNSAGKEVVMLYYGAPMGKLGKPAKELGAFKKTDCLAPSEDQNIELTMKISDMASYDDLGKVEKSAWVLEKGTYSFFVGNDVSKVEKLSEELTLKEDKVVCKLSEKLAPSNLKERLCADGSMEAMPSKPETKVESVLKRMTTAESEGKIPCERGFDIHGFDWGAKIKLIDVATGKNTLDEFMSQMSVEDMIHILGGQRNTGVSNTFGVGNMPEYGVPDVTTADGPAGLRIAPEVGVYTTAWPCATMLACSFNTDIAYKIGEAVAEEVKENNIGIWLAPAVNIHRSPMCGRNFEYYSEDPFVAGMIGSAVVKGVQSQKIAATVKHFAFNNKETNRKNSDSRVSERAAREIYLKAFEIIVKKAKPWCIMTSYNLVNGVQCSENKELITDILRGEWGFDGTVMTDWWTSGEHYLETKAGNDLKMANGYPLRVLEAYNKGAITKEEIYAATKNILGLVLRME
ncbi:MAG: glycoside hydrolase family 3 C-terminal domain-containing protein [Lachnospiraceae bacterium]|nr:glycoside hydrolase family 3 C-terminal domain-containing protein [Lachnospiraceae bacterium]